MTRSRAVLAAVAVVVIAVLAVVIRTGDRAADPPPAQPSRAPLWQAIPGAFSTPAGRAADVVSLVREKTCFSAVGTVRSGDSTVIASWTSAGDCRSARPLWPTAPPVTATDEHVLRVVDADGTELWHGDPLTVVVNPTRAYVYVLKGDPGGWEEDQFPAGPAVSLTAAGPDEPFLLVAGRRGTGLFAWLYSGWDWQRVPLPSPAGAEPLSVAAIPTVADKVIPPATVIVGHDGTHAVVWHSSAGGQDWQATELPEAKTLTDVVVDDSRLIAVGAAPDGGPVVLTSTDGVSWQVDTRALPADLTSPFRALFVLRTPSSGMVLGGPPPPPPPVYAIAATGGGCASVYRRDSAAWVEEPLGCHGVPSSLLQLSDGRVAAAGGTTLWLRSAPAG